MKPNRPAQLVLTLLLFLLGTPSFGDFLKEGETIPKVKLPTFKGKKIDVNGYAKAQGKRNLLLIFYRTGTCNVCVTQLRELASQQGKVREYNAAMLAVSLDGAIVQSRTSEQIAGKIPILLDPGAKTVKAFGVLHPQESLSRPSLYVVGPDQKVLYKYVGMALADRPPTQEVLEVLRHYSGLTPTKSGVAKSGK